MVVVCEVSRVRFLSIFYSGAAFWRRKNTRERCLFFWLLLAAGLLQAKKNDLLVPVHCCTAVLKYTLIFC